MPPLRLALVSLLGTTLAAYGWFVTILALGETFVSPLIAVGFSLMGTLLCFFLVRLFRELDFSEVILFGILLSYVIFLGYSTVPSVFSGRDQGSIAEAGILLAQAGETTTTSPIIDTFFRNYGAGPALNFPGFRYTEEGFLQSQFPLPYTAFLGSFYSLFGLSGFALANGTLLFFSCLIFYSLIRLFADRFYGFSGTILFAFSFPVAWFSKITLTENLALFLFLLTAYQVLLFRRHGKFLTYGGALAASGLLAFTRIEGFAILAITILLLITSKHIHHLRETYPKKSVAAPLVFFVAFFLAHIPTALPYYYTLGRAIRSKLSVFSTTETSFSSSPLPLLQVFFIYGLLFLFLLGVVSAILLIRRRHYEACIPLLLSAPLFVYFLFPSITPDHPWMLRRYFFALFPALLFCTTIGIALFFGRNHLPPFTFPRDLKRSLMVTSLLIGLFLLQFQPWKQAATMSDNIDLLRQIEEFSTSVGNRDLLLIDRGVTGSGFDMPTGPLATLFHKNAVYFFNPSDLETLDTTPFDRVLLLVPANNLSFYEKILPSEVAPLSAVGFATARLARRSLDEPTTGLPEVDTVTVRNFLFEVR